MPVLKGMKAIAFSKTHPVMKGGEEASFERNERLQSIETHCRMKGKLSRMVLKQ